MSRQGWMGLLALALQAWLTALESRSGLRWLVWAPAVYAAGEQLWLLAR